MAANVSTYRPFTPPPPSSNANSSLIHHRNYMDTTRSKDTMDLKMNSSSFMYRASNSGPSHDDDDHSRASSALTPSVRHPYPKQMYYHSPSPISSGADLHSNGKEDGSSTVSGSVRSQLRGKYALAVPLANGDAAALAEEFASMQDIPISADPTTPTRTPPRAPASVVPLPSEIHNRSNTASTADSTTVEAATVVDTAVMDDDDDDHDDANVVEVAHVAENDSLHHLHDDLEGEESHDFDGRHGNMSLASSEDGTDLDDVYHEFQERQQLHLADVDLGEEPSLPKYMQHFTIEDHFDDLEEDADQQRNSENNSNSSPRRLAAAKSSSILDGTRDRNVRRIESLLRKTMEVTTSPSNIEPLPTALSSLQALIAMECGQIAYYTAIEAEEDNKHNKKQLKAGANSNSSNQFVYRSPRLRPERVMWRVARSKIFERFRDAREVVTGDEFRIAAIRGCVMGRLARAAYLQDPVQELTLLEHCIVGHGLYKQQVRYHITATTEPTHFYLSQREDAQRALGGASDALERRRRPTLLSIRTITLCGLDFGDESIDMSSLLRAVATSTPQVVPIPDHEFTEEEEDNNNKNRTTPITVHSGLWELAGTLYQDVIKPVLPSSEGTEGRSPREMVVLNGHCVGGSIGVLVLIHLLLDKGIDYVKDHILKVYTFGSPCVVGIPRSSRRTSANSGSVVSNSSMTFGSHGNGSRRDAARSSRTPLSILEVLGLSPTLVQGYAQPWDPVPRVFTPIDPLFGVWKDVGRDGYTLMANGSDRVVKSVCKGVFRQASQPWKAFRNTVFYQQLAQKEKAAKRSDTYSEREMSAGGTFRPIGIQYILMSTKARYLSDRFLASTPTPTGDMSALPQIDYLLRVPSTSLLKVLAYVFPLDCSTVSRVGVVLRSLLHHMNSAYGLQLEYYVHRQQEQYSSSRRLGGG